MVEGVPMFDKTTINIPLEKDPTFPIKMRVAKSIGKESVTNIVVKERFCKFALIEAHPLTGRMHQIRIHLAIKGFPIIGDSLYGTGKLPMLSRIKRKYKPSTKKTESPLINRLALHALSIALRHPISGEYITFEAEPQKDFQVLLDQIRKFGIRR